MTNSIYRAAAVLALVIAASTAFAQAPRRAPAPPNFDAFYELGPDSLIRRGVPKGTVKGPVTIFMIDGRNDNRGVNAAGEYDQTRDWFYQNVRLKDALVAKGYDVNYAWGIGVHSHDMGGAMLPEMMRWLWRDHPVSVDPNDPNERSFRTGRPKSCPTSFNRFDSRAVSW